MPESTGAYSTTIIIIIHPPYNVWLVLLYIFAFFRNIFFLQGDSIPHWDFSFFVCSVALPDDAHPRLPFKKKTLCISWLMCLKKKRQFTIAIGDDHMLLHNDVDGHLFIINTADIYPKKKKKKNCLWNVFLPICKTGPKTVESSTVEQFHLL